MATRFATNAQMARIRNVKAGPEPSSIELIAKLYTIPPNGAPAAEMPLAKLLLVENHCGMILEDPT